MKKVTEQWLDAAADDLQVIARIKNDEQLSHMVAFHVQQCVEKSLKAIIEEYELGHIRIHSLARLFEIIKLKAAFDVDDDLVEKLDKLYIDARYPADLGFLPDGKPTAGDTEQFIDFCNGVHEQVKRTLSGKR